MPTRTYRKGACKAIVVADAVFPLEPTCLKYYDSVHSAQQYSFNYSLIRTRRVVEQAYGRLKGRWKIMEGRCGLNNPVFARQVAVLFTTFVNVISAHLRMVGYPMLVHTSVQLHLVYRPQQ
jgi:hypothetical protein